MANPSEQGKRINPESHPKITKHNFLSTSGVNFVINYYDFSNANLGLHNLTDSAFDGVRDNLPKMISTIFPNYDSNDISNTVDKFDNFSHIALAFSPEGKPVGFNLYKVGEVGTDVGKAKVIYVEHAGTLPEYRNSGISQEIRKNFFSQQDPDIICGSSANGVIYIINERLAKERGMAFYPKDANTPASVSKLANQIHDTLGLRNAVLDDRLVRTYNSPTSRGEMTHPLDSVLPLDLNQHIFYLLIKPELNQKLLES